MTVASTTTKVSYSGNGTTTVFTVPFYFLAAADLRVILRTGATETVQTLTTQYTVTGAGVTSGGTVTMLTAPASGTTLTILRNVSPTQETDLLPNDRLPAESLETALDKATMLIQQLDEVADRALQFPASDAAVSAQIPAASARASKFLSFDASGIPVATIGTDATTATFLQSGTGAVTRSVNDKLRDFVSVKDFGALGDGVTDDTAAIQLAINASDALIFPEGDYKVTSRLNVNKSMTIRVDGNIQTTGYQYQSNPPSIFYVTADNVLIEGGGTLSGPGVFTHAVITSIDFIPSLIKISSSDNVTIRGLTFVDGPQACVIYLDSDHVKIAGCTFIGGDTVANNKDTPNVGGINYYGVYCYSSDYSIISNNRFMDDASGNTFAEAIFMYITNYSEVTGNFFKNIVDHDLYMYHPSGTTTGLNNYNIVSNNVSYSTLIAVTEKIGASFKVHGVGNIISNNNVLNSSGGIILEQGSYSTISNNIIDGFTAHGIIVTDLVSTNADGLNYITISNNTLRAAAAASTYGIYFRGDATYTTANCVGGKIIGNTLVRCGDPGGSVNSPISLFHSNAAYFMEGFLVSDNVIVGQTGVYGMYIERVRKSQFSDNVIKDGTYTPWRGFHTAGNSSFNKVTNNIVRDDQASPKLSIGCNFGAVTDTDNILTGNIFHSLYVSRSTNPWGIDSTYRRSGDRNINGDALGYPAAVSTAEVLIAITATSTISTAVDVPTGSKIIGAQLRVDSALATGDTWDAAYGGGSSSTIATSQAVAKNTKVNTLFNTNAATDITSAALFVNITKNGGGNFTAQGAIRALVYYQAMTALGDAP